MRIVIRLEATVSLDYIRLKSTAHLIISRVISDLVLRVAQSE